MITNLTRHGVPEHLHEGLTRYVEHQIRPGSFLRAVLENDLHGAFSHGDPAAIAGLGGLVRWLHNCAPAACWGSPERVRDWLAKETT